MPWRSVVADLFALIFVAVMAVAVVYVERNMPNPPVMPAPPPKFVLINHVPKHEPKLVEVGQK
jgi:hypothetical protein